MRGTSSESSRRSCTRELLCPPGWSCLARPEAVRSRIERDEATVRVAADEEFRPGKPGPGSLDHEAVERVAGRAGLARPRRPGSPRRRSCRAAPGNIFIQQRRSGAARTSVKRISRAHEASSGGQQRRNEDAVGRRCGEPARGVSVARRRGRGRRGRGRFMVAGVVVAGVVVAGVVVATAVTGALAGARRGDADDAQARSQGVEACADRRGHSARHFTPRSRSRASRGSGLPGTRAARAHGARLRTSPGCGSRRGRPCCGRA